jgi:hypothetical protein
VTSCRSPVRELGGEDFVFGRLVLETGEWCRREGGGEWPRICASAVTLDTELGAALETEGRRSAELRRDRFPSNSMSLREGELRDEGDRDLSPWS